MLDTQTGKMTLAETGPWISSGSRGGFDRQGNAWYGGRGGMLMRMNIETKKLTGIPCRQFNTTPSTKPCRIRMAKSGRVDLSPAGF